MLEGADNPQVRPRIPAPGEVISLFTEAFGHRARLAQLELGEARDHLTVSGVLAAIAVIMGLLAGLAITLVFAALVWDSPHRTAWLLGLCGIYLTVTVAVGFILARRLRLWRPLAETKFQLDQDGDTVTRIVRSFRQP